MGGHDCGEVTARTRFKRTAELGMHRDCEWSASFLLHDTNLFASCRASHARHVAAALARVEQQVERESLLCSRRPSRFKLADLGFRPGMNLNRFERAHACGRITVAPSHFHRIAQQRPHSFKQDYSGAGLIRKFPKHGIDVLTLHLINLTMAVFD